MIYVVPNLQGCGCCKKLTYLTLAATTTLTTDNTLHAHAHVSSLLHWWLLISPCNAALWFKAQHLHLTIQTLSKNCGKLQTNISIEDILLNLFSQRVSEQCEKQDIVSGKTQLQRSQTLADRSSTACSEKLTLNLPFMGVSFLMCCHFAERLDSHASKYWLRFFRMLLTVLLPMPKHLLSSSCFSLGIRLLALISLTNLCG